MTVAVIINPISLPGSPASAHYVVFKLVDESFQSVLAMTEGSGVSGQGKYLLSSGTITVNLTPQDEILEVTTYWEASIYNARRSRVGGPYRFQLSSETVSIEFEHAVGLTDVVAADNSLSTAYALALTAVQPEDLEGLVAGSAKTYPAATVLSGHRALSVNDAGEVIYAQQSDSTALTVVGVSTTTAAVGEDVSVHLSGVLDWPSGGLTPYAPLYLANDGIISHTAPTTNWLRLIAVALTTNKILVSIGPAYMLGG